MNCDPLAQSGMRGAAVIGLAVAMAGHFFCHHCDAGTREWHEEQGFRWAALPVPKEGKTGFALLQPEQTGITFTNTLTELEAAANRVLQAGSGVAIGDFDNDGWPDIFFCGLDTPNGLYRNLGHWRFQDVTQAAGVDCPEKNYRGAVFADINGDGWLDLLISTTGRGVFCFLNDGHGKFNDTTQAASTTTKFGSMTLALADVDGNGTLDLYVTNYRTEDIRDRGHADLHLVNGQLTVPPWFKDRLLVVNGEVLEYGEPDQLYLNDGQGRFSPVSWIEGAFADEDGKKLIQPPLDWGLTATFRDFNNDGAPDIYVCNDYWPPDRIWLNDGRGHFHAIPKLALRSTSASSMGVDFADIDRDGHMDFIVVDMLSRHPRLRKRQILAYPPMRLPIGAIDNRPQFMRNTLFHNRGDGTFQEVANFSGVTASEWSWQPVFIDVDLDGFEDLLITSGYAKDVQDLDAFAAIQARQHSWRGFTNEVERQKAFTHELMVHNRLYPDLPVPMVAFRNRGNLTFVEATQTWGTDQPGVHHSLAMADFDGDGDLDLAVNNLGSAAGLYRNESSAPRVAVRLRGLSPNTQGIGAKIKLIGGGVPMQSQEVICGGRYLSGSEPMLVFAAGNLTNLLRIEVAWRSGKRSVVERASPNRIYEVDEAGAAVAQAFQPAGSSGFPVASPGVTGLESPVNRQTGKPAPQLKPFFEDVSDLLSHTHADQPFDDFARQSLLPKQLSQLGPGASWFDVNGDGWDDLIIGSGRAGRMSVFLNDTQGAFKAMQEPVLLGPITRDQTTVLGWRRDDGKSVLLAGSANYEDGLAVGAAVRQYDLGQKKIDDSLPGQLSSTGPLALADADGDGDLDLFVGGRVLPGRYPEPASSMLFRHNRGRWELDSENTKALARIGLVSGAVWSDLNSDGFPELVLACEWGPLRIYRNERGTLRPWDPPVKFPDQRLTLNAQRSTLNDLTGWWSGVTTGDIDGDGKLDIIASNWGWNSPYKASPRQPLRLYHGDFAQRRTVDLIETEFDVATGDVLPRRRLNPLAAALPFLRETFPSHKAFSAAAIGDVLKALPAKANETQAAALASMIFFNRGDRFDGVELPREAQMAPAFSVNVGDFDGDGFNDVFLSQNFFATQPEMPRLDAGRGLWLRGDGTGQLSAVPGQESGVRVYGEQRSAALCDFNGDGRLDLVVTQNGAATRLFRNAAAKPGLRVRLKGPPGNPGGIGAIIQLVFASGKGPARELHAGSGYWSQDSAVQVLGLRETPKQIIVHWPGGRSTTTQIPAPAKEIAVESTGSSVTTK